jgi:hypothetical protein
MSGSKSGIEPRNNEPEWNSTNNNQQIMGIRGISSRNDGI